MYKISILSKIISSHCYKENFQILCKTTNIGLWYRKLKVLILILSPTLLLTMLGISMERDIMGHIPIAWRSPHKLVMEKEEHHSTIKYKRKICICYMLLFSSPFGKKAIERLLIKVHKNSNLFK
jgi:hypothetical protein